MMDTKGIVTIGWNSGFWRMIILDAEKILGDEKIIVHQEAD